MVLALIGLASCVETGKEQATTPPKTFIPIYELSSDVDQGTWKTKSKHTIEIEAWRISRQNIVKQDWLTLAGLYWLQPGMNDYGSHADNDLVFPADFPEVFGYYELNSEGITTGIASPDALYVPGVQVQGIILRPTQHGRRRTPSGQSY